MIKNSKKETTNKIALLFDGLTDKLVSLSGEGSTLITFPKFTHSFMEARKACSDTVTGKFIVPIHGIYKINYLFHPIKIDGRAFLIYKVYNVPRYPIYSYDKNNNSFSRTNPILGFTHYSSIQIGNDYTQLYDEYPGYSDVVLMKETMTDDVTAVGIYNYSYKFYANAGDIFYTITKIGAFVGECEINVTYQKK